MTNKIAAYGLFVLAAVVMIFSTGNGITGNIVQIGAEQPSLVFALLVCAVSVVALVYSVRSHLDY